MAPYVLRRVQNIKENQRVSMHDLTQSHNPENKYLLKEINRNTKTGYDINNIYLVSVIWLTLNMFHAFF